MYTQVDPILPNPPKPLRGCACGVATGGHRLRSVCKAQTKKLKSSPFNGNLGGSDQFPAPPYPSFKRKEPSQKA